MIVQTLEGPAEDAVFIAAWSPDGQYVAVAQENGLVRVWEVASNRIVATFSGHSEGLKDVAWSPEGRRIVSVGNDRMVKIWDALSGEELYTYQASDVPVNAQWASSGGYVVVALYNTPTPLVLRAWQTTKDLIAYVKECCVWRELTPEERTQFGLP